MDKQKQIEEMAKELQRLYEKYGLFDFEWFAEDLHKLGYRKIDEGGVIEKNKAYKYMRGEIPENAVVLTEEEYNQLIVQYKCLDIKYVTLSDNYRLCKDANEVLKQNIVVLRKDTVEKFAERLKEKCEYNRKQYCCSATVGANDIDEIAKEIIKEKKYNENT